MVTIEVKNDGNALPTGFDPNSNSGIGLRIIQRMVESDLKGEVTLEQRGEFTVARMIFPAVD